MKFKRHRRPHRTDDSEARVIASAHDASSLGLCDMGSPEDRRYIVGRVKRYVQANLDSPPGWFTAQSMRVDEIFKEIACVS